MVRGGRPSLQTLRASLARGIAVSCALAASTTATADPVGELTMMPTDGAASHLFLSNPATHMPSSGSEAGILAARTKRTSMIEHQDEGGDKVETASQFETVAAAFMADAGAGMGVGIGHAAEFREWSTDFAERGGPDRSESTRFDQTTARAAIELTEGLNAGFSARLLRRQVSVLGDDGLGPDEATHYKVSFFGYSAGMAWKADRFGVSYAYEPPLHGKARVEGEDRIVVEPGRIELDAFFKPNEQCTLGLLARRALNEVDDLASGTTAEDDQTRISLYGLDPDQYVIPDRTVMVGVDWKATPAIWIRLAAGEERATFNFRDYFVYSQIDARQDQDDKDEGLRYYRYRAAAEWSQGKLQAAAALGYWKRERDLPSSMNGGSYEGKGTEMRLTLGTQL
jgi:hypothetical protein